MFDWLLAFFSGLFSLDVIVYPIMTMTFVAVFYMVYYVMTGKR